jgi:hypothetical protein
MKNRQNRHYFTNSMQKVKPKIIAVFIWFFGISDIALVFSTYYFNC